MIHIDIPYFTGRLVILADLHLDEYAVTGLDVLDESGLRDLLDTPLDALIIAGDLTEKWSSRLPGALEILARMVPRERIYLLPGNHDYYGGPLDDEWLETFARFLGVTLIQRTELRHGIGRILACTLWTDFDLLGTPEWSMQQAAAFMPDFGRIRKQREGVARIRPEDLLEIHRRDLHWLEHKAREPHFFGPGGENIIITHHIPHPDATSVLTPVSPAFASDLSDFIGRVKPNVWFCGHSHHRKRVYVQETEIRVVSVGYPEYDNHSDACDLGLASVWTSKDRP